MDAVELGPATPPDEAGVALYQQAMLIWRQKGDREDVESLLGLAQACALVSLARSLAVTR